MSTKQSSQYYTQLRFGRTMSGARTALHLFYTTTKSRVGSPNPMWKTQVVNGRDATTPFSAKSQTAIYQPGKVTCKVVDRYSPYYGNTYYGTAGLGFAEVVDTPVNSFFLGDVKNHALIAIIKRIRQATGGNWSWPQQLVELHKTIKGLLNPVKALRDLTIKFCNETYEVEKARRLAETSARRRAARAKNRYERRRIRAEGQLAQQNFHQAISKLWLEWSFHAKPLAGTIADALEESIPRFDSHDKVVRVSKRWFEETSATTLYTNGIDSLPVVGHWDRVDKQQVIVKYRVGISKFWDTDYGKGGLKDRFMHTIRMSRSDVFEVLPAVYEAIPFSWLADYFVNLGQLLGCGFTYNSGVSWINVTTRTIREVDYVPRAIINNGAPSIEMQPGSFLERFTSQQKRIERVSLPRLGFPRLEFRVPAVASQFANMAAVLDVLTNSTRLRRS